MPTNVLFSQRRAPIGGRSLPEVHIDCSRWPSPLRWPGALQSRRGPLFRSSYRQSASRNGTSIQRSRARELTAVNTASSSIAEAAAFIDGRRFGQSPCTTAARRAEPTHARRPCNWIRPRPFRHVTTLLRQSRHSGPPTWRTVSRSVSNDSRSSRRGTRINAWRQTPGCRLTDAISRRFVSILSRCL